MARRSPVSSSATLAKPRLGFIYEHNLPLRGIDRYGRRPFCFRDIEIERNAYGRQLGSFHAVAEVEGLGQTPMTFIRAPRIVSVGNGVSVLAKVDDRIVCAREGNQLACTFHPELDRDARLHELFLRL